MKQYTSKTILRAARPRSERLKNQGIGSSISNNVVLSGGSGDTDISSAVLGILNQFLIPHYDDDGNLFSLEATVNLYSRGEVSAFGIDDSGGGGGGGSVTVYDGLDSTNPNIALSANQGRVLKGLIDNMDLSAYALKSELATVATSGSYNDLTNKPTIPAAQIQSDWNQTTTAAKDYIKNKPTKLSQFTNDANYVTSSSLTTTLASYATTSAMNTALSGYLPLTGGTMTGRLITRDVGTTWAHGFFPKYSAITFHAIDDDQSYHPYLYGTSFDGSVWNLGGIQTRVGIYGYVADHEGNNTDWSTWWNTTNGYLTHSGGMNVGGQITSSVANGTAPLVIASSTLVTNLNADLLDGIHASGLFTELENSGNNISLTIGGTNKTLQVGYADNANSASTATTLKNSRTIWGQSFNGSANVRDTLYMLSSTAEHFYNPSAKLKFNSADVDTDEIVRRSPYIQALGGSSYGRMRLSIFQSNATNYTDDFVEAFTVLSNGNVGVNTSAPTHKLHVEGTGYFSGLITASGNIKAASYIEIGDYRIVADTANTALKVVNKDGTTAVNFYATGENSALGVNTSGGGSGGDGASLAAVWTSLGDSTGTYGSSQINASHLTKALADYATQSWVNQQGFLKSYTETDPVFTASAAYGITSANISTWNNKQDAISDLATIRSNASAGAAKVSNVQADWNATSGLAVILHKPTLATVATSGKYSDLTGTPTKVSDFTNDANYVTSSSLTTTLASYATTSAMNTELAKYLLLTGGTLTGNLEVSKSNAKVLANNGTSIVSLHNSTNRGVYDDTNSLWLIATNGTNTFLMDGNVGIGTSSPSYKLHVNGAAYATNLYLNGENRFTGSDTQLVGYIGNVATLTIEDSAVRRGFSNANITLGTSSYRWANLYSALGNFSGQITSSVATGTSPLSVASTTLNTNLNADLLDGHHATELARLGWKEFTTWNPSSGTSCRWREIDAPATEAHKVVYDIVSFRFGYPHISYYRLTLFSHGRTSINVSLVNLGTAYRSIGQSRICVGVATNGKVYIQSGSTGANNFLYVRNILSTDEVSAGTIHTESVGEAAFGTANGFTAAKIITDTGYCRVNRSTGAVDTSGDPSITTSLRIGNACIWWDETNNCLRITGANANGVQSTSVAVNVNVSGEVSALKTS